MSPLHCNTVQEALWERAASLGPAPLSPTLADHLSTCLACQIEGRAVRDLLAVSKRLPDPEPPEDIWDGFERELAERLDALHDVSGWSGAWARWQWRVAGAAAALAVGFALGVLAMRVGEEDPPAATTAQQSRLLAELQAEISNDARLEFYLDEIETLLVSYQAMERGEAVDVFRQSLPSTMVAGPGVPSEADRQRLEQQRAAREQLRSVVLGMLAGDIEVERRGFGYLDRQIAELAGQQLLYFVQ